MSAIVGSRHRITAAPRSTKPISIVLVGAGGFGNRYVEGMLDVEPPLDFELVAIADPAPTNCTRLSELNRREIPMHASLEEFYATGARADLVVLCLPIHLHCRETCRALLHGSHVLCEKPVAATPEQAREMMRARDAIGATVAIGFQWSFSRAVHALKADIRRGLLGCPRRLSGLVQWPRDEAYYQRSWAGRRFTPDGLPVFDSPLNNACAHYLHNMLYLLGDGEGASITPATVAAELYRANPIETNDTAIIRCRTAGSAPAELLLAVSHVTRHERGPLLAYEFEHATIHYDGDADGHLIAHFTDGRTHDYGSPEEPFVQKLWNTVADIRTGATSLCGIEAAMPHALCIAAADQSTPQPHLFPASITRQLGGEGHRRFAVDGLEEVLMQCFHSGHLPSELGVPWARPADEIRVDSIRHRSSDNSLRIP